MFTQPLENISFFDIQSEIESHKQTKENQHILDHYQDAIDDGARDWTKNRCQGSLWQAIMERGGY